MIRNLLATFIIVTLIGCGTGQVHQERIKDIKTVGVISIIGFSARFANKPGILEFNFEETYHDFNSSNLNAFSEEIANHLLSKRFKVVQLEYKPQELFSIYTQERNKIISNNWGKMPLVIKDYVDLSEVDAVIYIFPNLAEEQIAIYTDSAIGIIKGKKNTISYCKAMIQLLRAPDMKLTNYNDGIGIGQINEFELKENLSNYSQNEMNDIHNALKASIAGCVNEALLEFGF